MPWRRLSTDGACVATKIWWQDGTGSSDLPFLVLELVNTGYAELRADPQAWAEHLAERKLWDATLMDGLDSDEHWTEDGRCLIPDDGKPWTDRLFPAVAIDRTKPYCGSAARLYFRLGSLIVISQQYRTNRASFPATTLGKYQGSWVAFSADGRRILASAESVDRLEDELAGMGKEAQGVVLEWLAGSEDDSVLGGGELL
jgi:hypothetical protein